MNKTELKKAVAEKAELKQVQAGAAIDAVLETIAETLARGEKISLVGFGTFEVRERAARNGRNPQTGEEITIEATKSPAFKAGKQLKDAVKQG
jgi:DNA-binding protein HU-beta